MRKKRSKLHRVENNLMERGWNIRRINENAVEEKLVSDLLKVSLFFSGSL